MNLRKVKKQDLYPGLDEIQKAFKEQYNFNHLHETVSDTYGKYQRELCFVYNYSSEYLRKLSNELQDEFHKLHCGYASVDIKDFPENYPEFIKDQLGAEIVAYYISTERLNDLPINDDLRLARFIIKNKENILTLIKGTNMKFKCYMSNQIKHSKSDDGERIQTIVPIDTELAFSRIINRHVILDNQNEKVYYCSEMYNPNLRFIRDKYNQNSIRKSLKSIMEFDIGYCEVQPEYLVEWLNWKLNNLIEVNPCNWNDELLKREIINLKKFIKKVEKILELK